MVTERNLFNEGHLQEYCRNRLRQLEAEAATLNEAAVADQAAAVLALRSKWEVPPLRLGTPTSLAVADSGPREVTATFSVPFEGDGHLFLQRPSSTTSLLPRAELDRNHLTFSRADRDPEAEALKKWRDEEVDRLTEWVGWVNRDLGGHYSNVAQAAESCVRARRETLDRLRRLRDELAD